MCPFNKKKQRNKKCVHSIKRNEEIKCEKKK